MLTKDFKLISEDDENIFFKDRVIKKSVLTKELIDKQIELFKEKTDYKALSHSMRISLSVKELLETNFIKFPLENAKYIKEIKEGKTDTQKVIDEIQDILEEVDVLLLASSLPEHVDESYIDLIVLRILDEFAL